MHARIPARASRAPHKTARHTPQPSLRTLQPSSSIWPINAISARSWSSDSTPRNWRSTANRSSCRRGVVASAGQSPRPGRPTRCRHRHARIAGAPQTLIGQPIQHRHQYGDVDMLRRLLADNPGLATAQLGTDGPGLSDVRRAGAETAARAPFGDAFGDACHRGRLPLIDDPDRRVTGASPAYAARVIGGLGCAAIADDATADRRHAESGQRFSCWPMCYVNGVVACGAGRRGSTRSRQG
jgi:hypothetical protein